ncbi:MAG: thioredoxin [Chloroflexi bacterium]|nr:thioredoxin [Chloroflexota bacterium]
MAKPKEVTEQSFEQEVLQAGLPVLVDFWAPWCGPCHMIDPIVEELANEYEGKAIFTKLNVDEAPNIALKYQVMSIPTLIVFEKGKPAAQVVGAMPKKALRERLLARVIK